MSKTLDYIADLERENRLVKSILYCTRRSCNNCGKVNCENFQRQRIDCCGLWVSYKDYIKQQEGQIADIKANCDYILEGKEIEYREERNKLCADFENMKATLESKIAVLEQQIDKMKKYIKACWVEENLNDYSSYITNSSDEFRDFVKGLNEEIRNGR